MAPSAGTRARSRSITTKKPIRSYCKKQTAKSSVQLMEDLPSNNCSTTTTSSKINYNIDGLEGNSTTVDISTSTSSCSTPKAERFRIPETVTCPPAPKKQRVLSNCSLRRRPIAFFAPPDLELFFFFAFGDISV